MSWKERNSFHRDKINRRPDGWYASVNTTGVRLLFPFDHSITQSEHIRLFFGEDDDHGWIMLVPTESKIGARSVSITPQGRRFLHFKIFPDLDPKYRLLPTLLETRDDDKMKGVVLRLPWLSSAPKIVDILTQVPVDSDPKVVRQLPSKQSNTDAAKIEEFLAKRDSVIVMSLEQAAECVRTMGYDCLIREFPMKRVIGGPLVQPPSVIMLEGSEMPVEGLFKLVNNYRQAHKLPPVALPPSVA